MSRNLLKYKNMEEFVQAQENDQNVESIFPGVAYVKEMVPTPNNEQPNEGVLGAGYPAPDGSGVFYNEVEMPPVPNVPEFEPLT